MMTNEKNMAVDDMQVGEVTFEATEAARVREAWDALSADEETMARMERRFLAAAEHAGGAAPAPSEGDRERAKAGRTRRLRRWVRTHRAQAAAAAAIAVVLVVGGAVTSMQMNPLVESGQLGIQSFSLSDESDAPTPSEATKDTAEEGLAFNGKSASEETEREGSSTNAITADETAPRANTATEPEIASKSTEYSSSSQRGGYSSEKIIYTANAQVATDDYETARAALKEKAAAVKAKVESEQETMPYPDGTNSARQRPTLIVTYRVPTGSFEAFLESLSDVGTVTSKTSNAANISQTYSETESRIKSLEIQKKRLEEMLKEAEGVDEMLQIEEQLQEIRSELEFEKNEKSRMDNDVDYSTVTVTLVDVSELPVDGSDDSFVAQLGRAAAGAWKAFTDLLAGIVIFAVSVWPLWIVLAIAAVVAHVVRKKRGPKGDATPIAPDDAE